MEKAKKYPGGTLYEFLVEKVLEDNFKDLSFRYVFPLIDTSLQNFCPICKEKELKKGKKYCSRKCFYNRNK